MTRCRAGPSSPDRPAKDTPNPMHCNGLFQPVSNLMTVLEGLRPLDCSPAPPGRDVKSGDTQALERETPGWPPWQAPAQQRLVGEAGRACDRRRPLAAAPRARPDTEPDTNSYHRKGSAPAQRAVCSPTISPPRIVAKPIAPSGRAPVRPSREVIDRASRSTPRAAAMALPMASAVPDGASTLCR